MPVASVELILFAIQAGIRLIQTGRKIYVETTIGGEVEVPLPPSFEKTPVAIALQYASSLKQGDTQSKERFTRDYKDAWDKYNSADLSVSADGGWLLVQQYILDMAKGLVISFNHSTAELASIVVIKQWERDKSPFPSAIQRFAGSLVEISIDYFLNVPGALNENSKQGKAVKSFLQGLADFEFQDSRWDSIAIALFTTALGTLNDHPDLITDEADDQSLIQKIVSGVASDVSEKLKTPSLGNLDAEAHLKRFSQIVLRSLLKNGGTAILDSPVRLGFSDEGGKALIQSVGSAFLDLLLTDDTSSLTIDLRKVASTEGFDRLVCAALKAVVEHPDDFSTGNDALNMWLKGVLTDLYKWNKEGQKSLSDPELFIEIAYSVIDNGLRDLPFFLTRTDAKPSLLVEIAHQVFDILTIPPSDNKPPRFKSLQLSRSDLKDLFNGVLTSLTANASWLQKRPELQKEATTLIPLMVAVLSDFDSDTLKALIRSDHLSTVIAAALASEILKPADSGDKEKIIAGMKVILAAVRDSGVNGSERLLDKNVLLDLLSALANSGAAGKLFGGNKPEIAAVVTILIPIMEDLRSGRILTVSRMALQLKQTA